MKEKKGRNGGTLRVQEKGDAAPPGAGRRENPFRRHIRELAEKEQVLILKGRKMVDGEPTGELVEFAVSLPGAMGVVMKAYKRALKGDAQARKWLTETGWDKTVKLGNDEDSPLIAGFSFIIEDRRKSEDVEQSD